MSYRSLNRMAAIRRTLAPRSRAERLALVAGLAGLGLGTALTAGAALAPPPPDRAALRAAAAGLALCPDGWAAVEARHAGVTEAEMTARYVAATFRADDDAVLRLAERHLVGVGAAPSRAEARIALCVAASRGLLGSTAPAS